VSVFRQVSIFRAGSVALAGNQTPLRARDALARDVKGARNMSITHTLPSPETKVRHAAALTFAGWALLAFVASTSGWISPEMPRPLFPLMIWSPVIAFVAAFRFSPPFRQWVLGWDLRWPILYHFSRVLFGVWFLVLHARGALDSTFALVAGPGDIAAGLLALVAVRFVPLRTRRDGWVVGAWNALALLDILVVFATAQRIVFFGAGPLALAPLTTFPLGLVPSLVVPLILISHFAVFAQVFESRKRSSRAAA
jgi:hypothetical protein